MCSQHIALVFTILIAAAAAAKAATNMAPAPHPPRCQTETVHSNDVLLPQRCQKVL
jgi:hypothetical protein